MAGTTVYLTSVLVAVHFIKTIEKGEMYNVTIVRFTTEVFIIKLLIIFIYIENKLCDRHLDEKMPYCVINITVSHKISYKIPKKTIK